MVQYATLLLACLFGSAMAGKQISTDGTLACGILPSGNKDKASDLGDELAGKKAGASWTVGPKECNRVHCDDTTGVYVCNVRIPRPISPHQFSNIPLPLLLLFPFPPCVHVARTKWKRVSKQD